MDSDRSPLTATTIKEITSLEGTTMDLSDGLASSRIERRNFMDYSNLTLYTLAVLQLYSLLATQRSMTPFIAFNPFLTYYLGFLSDSYCDTALLLN